MTQEQGQTLHNAFIVKRFFVISIVTEHPLNIEWHLILMYLSYKLLVSISISTNFQTKKEPNLFHTIIEEETNWTLRYQL